MCSDIIKINMLINPIFVIHKIVSGDKAKAEVNLMKEKTWANIFMENGILMIEPFPWNQSICFLPED